MKAEFQVLKARPKIPVVLTRDSVCAGDDCDAPHEKTVEVYDTFRWPIRDARLL